MHKIKLILLIGFVLEILAETGFGFDRVIFTGFSLKNVILLILILAVLFSGSKSKIATMRKRLRFTGAIHRNYALYTFMVLLATAVSVITGLTKNYDLAQAVISIKSVIIDPYLVFLIFLLYPDDRREYEKLLMMCIISISILSALTILASAISPGMFFGLDNDSARPNGPLGEPNQTAAVLSMVLVMSLAMAMQPGRYRLVWICCVVFLFGCILESGSRGGLLATLLAIPIFLFSIRRTMGPGKKLMTLLTMVIGGILTWILLPDRVHDLILSRLGILDTSHIDWFKASAGRTYLWAAAWDKWLESPLIGYGWRGFVTMMGNPTHNSFLEVLISSGPLGLIFYILIFKNLAILFKKSGKRGIKKERIIINGYLGSIIALIVAIFFVNLYTPWLVVWAFIGLMMGYSHIIYEKDKDEVSMDKYVIKSSGCIVVNNQQDRR